MGKFIELIDDDNQSVLINTDWIIYIEEDTKDQVIVYWGVPLSNGQGSIIARKQFKVSIHQLKEKFVFTLSKKLQT